MTNQIPPVRARWWLATSLALALLVPVLPGPTPAAADPPPTVSAPSPEVAIPTRDVRASTPLDAALLDDAAAGKVTPGEAGRADAGTAGADDVTVVIEATDGATAAAAAAAHGGKAIEQQGTAAMAAVPAAQLNALATADGVLRVREPEPVQMEVLSEGVGNTRATAWQTGGTTGAGTTVAILDGGFADYASKLGSELPASVQTDFARCGGAGASPHGTAVAEIVHDMAPGATLRLVCIENDFDFVSALGQMAANGVDVVNASIGFNLTGRGDGADGVGTIAEAVRKLRDQNILYVASAGNSGSTHSNFVGRGDSVGNEQSWVNVAADDEAMGFVVPGNGTVRVDMKWDAWPTTRQDFDLYIFSNECGLLNVGLEGLNDQASSALPPVESVDFTNCAGSDGVFFVLIDRWSGTATPRIDLYFNGDVYFIEHPTGSSIVEPGTSPAVMTVGAYCESNGIIEWFSSTGPTIDGRVKPDIAGPDGTSSSVYGLQTDDGPAGCNGGFLGTSAAAPHAAGAAALLLQANPGLDVAELQELLESRALDAGSAGVDNVFGAGKLRLGPPGDATIAAPQAFTGMTPVRLYDSRPGTVYPAEGAAPGRTTPAGQGTVLSIPVRGFSGVPDDAVAVILNVTAVAPTAAGWLTVYPGGAVPTSSNVNFAPGQTIPVHVTATVGDDDRVRIRNAVGSTHVIVDVAGWYGPSGESGPSTDRLTPLTAPARALDSRPGSPQGYAEGAFGAGGRTTPVPEDSDISVRVAGLGGVPVAATAVVMNVTAVAPTKGTFLTAYPTGETRPDASNLNAKAGQTIANLVVMPVGTDGEVTFYNQRGNTHLVVDVVGWYQPNVGAGYVALDPPTRNLDSRTGTGLRRTVLGPNATHKLKVAHYNGVPSDAAAIMLSVVAVSQSAITDSWLTVYPGTSSLPGTSSVNFAVGATTANAVVSRVGTDGTVAFNNARSNAHVIADLAGYFIDPANVPVP